MRLYILKESFENEQIEKKILSRLALREFKDLLQIL